MAVILVGLVAVTGIICLIGFTIGGRMHPVHFAIFLAASLALGTAASVVLYMKDQVIEMPKNAVIIATLLFFFAFIGGYPALNSVSKEAEYISYQSEVTEVSYSYRNIVFETVHFKDSEGNEAKKIAFQTLNADEDYDFGTKIQVKQWQGGFGYPVYEIEKVTKNESE